MIPLKEIEDAIKVNPVWLIDYIKLKFKFSTIPLNSVNGIGIDEDGTKWWYKNGLIHRENGPAVEFSNGAKWWYKNGLIHRENGPAVEFSNGAKHWYKNGLVHRENGPAVEYSDGLKEWWLNGKLYRNGNLPTIECAIEEE